MADYNSVYESLKNGKYIEPKEWNRFAIHCRNKIKYVLSGSKINCPHLADNMLIVDDLLSRLMLAISQNIKDFNPDIKPFRNWVHGIIYKLIFGYLKELNRDKNPPMQEVKDFNEMLKLVNDYDRHNSPELSVVNSDTLNRVVKLINIHLTRNEYNIMICRVFKGMNSKETAHYLGIKADKVDRTLSRARKKIREEWIKITVEK